MSVKKWSIDPMHTEIRFKIRHLMISHVTGSFNKFEGSAESEENDFSKGSISFSTEVNSIDTGNEQRDHHLQAPDFFDAAQFPQIKFKSTKIESNGDDGLSIEGDLTIKGVTKSVKLEAEAGGTAKDSFGNNKAGFTITGKINRKDFGLTVNPVTETGGIVLGEDVKIDCEVQLTEAK